MQDTYLFTSSRLGFRNWEASDVHAFARLNADPEVMRYFPATLTREASKTFMKRLQGHFRETGYTYYATELLDSRELIGFIGLLQQDYVAPFTPATDIGWRLLREHWGQGYAAEGAKRCLHHAFDALGLNRVVSVCPKVNSPSELVMRKVGMQRQGEFEHPGLRDHPWLNPCIWYEIKKSNLPKT
jgi:RimJ/RimL family protein N-acetyltransferase